MLKQETDGPSRRSQKKGSKHSETNSKTISGGEGAKLLEEIKPKK